MFFLPKNGQKWVFKAKINISEESGPHVIFDFTFFYGPVYYFRGSWADILTLSLKSTWF